MKSPLVLLIPLIAILLLGCTGNEKFPEGNIYYFFSPECPHCNNVKPFVENASKKVDIKFCQVEKLDEECKEIAEKAGLKGVPTVVRVENGKLAKYVGEVEVRELMISLVQ
jgi:thiol-disulfide isomerase/thioredoxin